MRKIAIHGPVAMADVAYTSDDPDAEVQSWRLRGPARRSAEALVDIGDHASRSDSLTGMRRRPEPGFDAHELGFLVTGSKGRAENWRG